MGVLFKRGTPPEIPNVRSKGEGEKVRPRRNYKYQKGGAFYREGGVLSEAKMNVVGGREVDGGGDISSCPPKRLRVAPHREKAIEPEYNSGPAF